MKNMNKLLKQAQKMQSQVMKAQEELQKKEFEGVAGGGMVKVVVNGKNELVTIKLNPEVVDPDDVEMLEDLIMAAHKTAMEQVKEASDSAFGAFSGGMPGMPGL
ncbi:MAG: YbaB/EbfC family nucleoid-associated protein [Chitinispirillaceae bacterium]